nr:AraC family ligand binding domain-containing protein [Kiritimatiellia bacterium]
MKKRAPLKLSFDYMDTAERRVLSLEDDGLFCLPVIGFDNYRKKWQQAALHVHEECLEITLCLRGDLEFETRSKTYPFKPGSIFVSGPKDVHRLKSYPKGMSKYWLLFRIPGPDCRLLELPPASQRPAQRWPLAGGSALPSGAELGSVWHSGGVLARLNRMEA